MSWDVALYDGDKLPVTVPHFEDGGTYPLGGTNYADLNVTYNYGGEFRRVFDGVGFEEALDGKRAGDLIPLLEAGVKELGTARDPDYWKATAGNAGIVLARLLQWARLHPDAVWSVS